MTFLSNYVVVIIFVVNLVTITSHPQPDGGIVVRKRSYDGHKKDVSPNHAVKPSQGRSAVFATENSTVVVAQIGGTAVLPCVVRKPNTAVVTWVRKIEPPILLSFGLVPLRTDGRIFVEHARHLQNWELLIKHVEPSDEGTYECQLATHPPTSIYIQLKVTEASAEILGSPDLHLRAGSLLRLVCTLKQSTEPPAYVFWYHEDRMINYDPGVKVIPDRESSILQIVDADKSHYGNYTCKPSNAIPASINVHVLNATEEENPAAMLHANNCNSSPSIYILLAIGLMTNLFLLRS